MDPRGTNTAAAAYTLVQGALRDLRSTREKISEALASLPVLSKEDLQGVDLEEPCPICLVPLSAIFSEGEAIAAKDQENADEGENSDSALTGVTKLVDCGHIFCRRDLAEWIQSQHGSCPTCRHTFMNIQPLSESDDESSDGGEYIPNADDFEDEDEDAFIDVDGFTDTDADDFPVESMDLDLDEIWDEEGNPASQGARDAAFRTAEYVHDAEMTDVGDDDQGSEWGLTDGESESMSSSEAGEMTVEDDEAAAAVANMLDREVSVSVHEDEDIYSKENQGIDTRPSATNISGSTQDKDASSTS